MSEIIFATPETLVQPKGSLVLEVQKPEDYVLGANNPKKLGKVILEDGHWAKFIATVVEIQRMIDGDTYGCTCYSDNEIDEALHKCQYGTEINISDRFVTVGSGTSIQNGGNSMKAASEFKRTKGFLFEDEYPVSLSMTLGEFYKTITSDLFAKALPRKDEYKTNYLFVGGQGQEDTLNALKISPLKIAIEGRYVLDVNGRLVNTGGNYNHAVVLFDYVKDENGNIVEYWIRCSETKQNLRMAPSYAFLSSMIKTLEKKTMQYKLYKKIGQSAIAVKHWSKDSLIAFGDGKLPGGDLFKSLYNITEYSQLQREDCVEWPFPIETLVTTTDINGASIISE